MTPSDTLAPPKRPKWDALLLVLTLLVFLQVWRVQGLVPGVHLLGLPVLCTVVALLLLSLDRDPRRRLHSLNHPVVRAALGIVVLVVASIPGSLYPGQSLSFLLLDYLRAVILMFLIAASVRGLADLRRLAWVQVVGVTLCSTAIVATSQMGSEGRLSSVAYYDANDLAMLIVCTLPLVLYLWQRPTGPFGRVGLAAATVFLLRTLGQTGSRGGFLGFVAVGGYLLLRFHGISGAKRVGAVALLVILLGVFASDRYFERIQTILHPSADYNWSGKSETGRMDIWKRGIGYMLEHPAFGVGAANFEKAEGTLAPQARERLQYGRSFQWSTAHNSFIQIGAEIGVGGVLLFSALLIGAFRTLSAARRGPPGEARVLAQILTGSLVAYVVTASLLSQAYSAYLYALLGMTLGLARVVSPAGAPWAPKRPAPSPSIWGPSRVPTAFPASGGLRRDAR